MTMLRTVYKIPNGQTTTDLMSPEYDGAVVFVFFYNAGGAQVTPTGEPTVSRRVGSRFVQVYRYGQDEWRFNGPADLVQISLAGVSGYTTYEAFVWRAARSIELMPPGVFSGLRAITVQNYTEANVKNGVQYEISSRVAALAPGANNDTILTTGANPVIIKARELSFNGAQLEARVYIGPTYTGGAIIPYFNLNTRNPVAGTVVVRGGVSVTSVGTEIAAPTYAVGSSGALLSTISSARAQGTERILAANSSFLLRVTNTDSSAQMVTAYASWYEGGTDLPL